MIQENVLLWLHEDCLHPHSLLLQRYPHAPRVFVFDDAAITQLSFKRIVFQYECLLEIPALEIRRGAFLTELREAAREHDCRRIATMASVSPALRNVCRALQNEAGLSVEVVAPEPFLNLLPNEAAQLDLQRFSRYWQRLKTRALSLTQSFPW